MKFSPQKIEGLVLIEPVTFHDERGTFRRNFCAVELKKNGVYIEVCQGNISENLKKYTLRGFHYQKAPSSESKILTVIRGAVYNVVVDLRPASQTYLEWIAFELLSQNRQSLYVPAGCANAFLTLEDHTVVQYYMGDYFQPDSYMGFRYDDKFFSIKWPAEPNVISDKDASFDNFSPVNL